jgi:competence protein ComFC
MFLNTILEIFFPVKCVACGRAGSELCLFCLSLAPRAKSENLSWIFTLYDYRHPPIKKALWLLKYNGKKRLAKIFAEILYERILEELSELSIIENFREPILIPIPLSSKRYHERGYNQAQLICEELVRLSKTNDFTLANNILIKPKETEHQARLKDRRTRLKNIVGSFAVKEKNINLIKNRNIILIDDITTTGATLVEAKKVLKNAGARKIIAFTIAH